MKRLLLLRHAKAEQSTSRGDHARVLAPRGRRSAPLVAKAMRKSGYIPDMTLCSTAARTRETWALTAPELRAGAPVTFTETLYLAPWQAIMKIACETDDKTDTLMIVGHNPGLEECAAILLQEPADDGERKLRTLMAEKYPTGALAVIDCDIPRWRDLAPACGAVTAFIRPRDLE